MDNMTMTLRDALIQMQLLGELCAEGKGREYEEIVLEEEACDHKILGCGPVVDIPSLGISMMEMSYLAYDSDWDEYLGDWNGTAFFKDGEYVGCEQDPMGIAFHNFCRILVGFNPNPDEIEARVIETVEVKSSGLEDLEEIEKEL